MNPKDLELKKMRERIAKRKASAERKRKLVIEILSVETFCEILDGLTTMFRFELININEDFDGYWEKRNLDGETIWCQGNKFLSNSSLFPFKEKVLEAIEREGRRPLSKIYRKENSIRTIRKKGEITSDLTKEKLRELYIEKKKSLEDIAKEFGCSRNQVSNIMKKHGLIRRTQSKARIEAIKKGKFESFEYHEINEKFFSDWTPEMAWVLGLLFTDGSIDKKRASINSIDLDLLEKIKKLLNSSNPIAKRSQSYDKSKHIYQLGFYREEMRDDLNKLGLQERKSLNMVFPDVPEEYMRHFIRGCWDGDGSLFFARGNLEASYVSGSKKFMERLVQELNKIGISRRDFSYRIEKGKKRVLLPITEVMRSDYPDGKFPLVINEDKRSNAYYIKIRTRENVEKLFHYFYDGVDESMYLSRKYNVFVKGLKLEKSETEQLTLDLDF